MNSKTLSRRQKLSRKSPVRVRRSMKLAAGRSMDLAALEPRRLFCALHDGGAAVLPASLGTFPAVHSDLDHDPADLDTDYPGVAADTTSGTATVRRNRASERHR